MPPLSRRAIDRFRSLPRRPDDTWQGAVVRLRAWIEEPDGALRRPRAAVWVSLATGLVNVAVETPEAEPDATLALRALVELGLRFAKGRPARLEVADEALGASLRAGLEDAGLAVHVREATPAVHEMVRLLTRDLGGVPPPPDALDAPGVTVARMRAFAAAAQAFYRAAPWRYLSDADLVRVEAPPVARGLKYLTVLGAAGQTFGVAFFERPKDFETLQADPDPTAVGERGRWAVLFGPLTDLPFGDVDLWEDHRLPVAGPAAYPVAVWFGPEHRIRRPGASELADLETLLLALASSTEAEIDAGRWTRQVATHAGPRTVTLAIPALLEPLDAPGTPRPGLPDRRAMERVLAEVERFVRGSGLDSIDEINAALRQRFSGPIEPWPSTAATPLEEAQELMYRAFEARGRRRIQLARRALELSADCADAYVVLAEESRSVQEARELYEAGVAAGERALGPVLFAEEAGHFWAIVRTRPYMRARFGLAQALEALGRREDAIAHYRDLLRLNPADNQGVRFPLLAALFATGRDEEAAALLERFGDEPLATWRYGHALLAFRRQGDSPTARARLRRALRTNRHVPRLLLGQRQWAGPMPDCFVPGSPEEAVICESELGEAWRQTPGAADWLAGHARRRPPGRRRR
jgi:tetratricopeptide (TPR) repeat protein